MFFLSNTPTLRRSITPFFTAITIPVNKSAPDVSPASMTRLVVRARPEEFRMDRADIKACMRSVTRPSRASRRNELER